MFFRICLLILAIIYNKENTRILCFLDPKRLSSANSFWGILQRSPTKLEVVQSNFVLFMDLMKLWTWSLKLTKWSAISLSKCWLILMINQMLVYVFSFWTSKCSNNHFWIICYYICTFWTSTFNIGINAYVYICTFWCPFCFDNFNILWLFTTSNWNEYISFFS